jgi:hypothetical protein
MSAARRSRPCRCATCWLNGRETRRSLCKLRQAATPACNHCFYRARPKPGFASDDGWSESAAPRRYRVRCGGPARNTPTFDGGTRAVMATALISPRGGIGLQPNAQPSALRWPPPLPMQSAPAERRHAAPQNWRKASFSPVGTKESARPEPVQRRANVAALGPAAGRASAGRATRLGASRPREPQIRRGIATKVETVS